MENLKDRPGARPLAWGHPACSLPCPLALLLVPSRHRQKEVRPQAPGKQEAGTGWGFPALHPVPSPGSASQGWREPSGELVGPASCRASGWPLG